MKKRKTFITLLCVMAISLALLVTSNLSAFDWPQPPENISTLFSQIRGDHFNSGVIFSNQGEVAVAESGTAIMVMKTGVSDMGWFESPLGNAVIVSHQNDMLSVYANLANIQIDPNNRTLQIGEIIGTSGDSGWKTDNENLEFQIMDTKLKTSINPVILMDSPPPVENYDINKITAVSRNGENFVLTNRTSLDTGTYTLYMNQQPDTMIHNATVTLNGVIKETVSYDILKQSGSTLGVQGNKHYPFNAVYPDNTLIRLSEIILSRGTNTIAISVIDVTGEKDSISYRVTVK